MNNFFVGIDPGKSGSLCVLSEDRQQILFYDFPQKEHEVGEYFNELWSVYCTNISMSILERVHSMPQQSSQSSFTFGMNFGMWNMFLGLTKKPYDLVTPQKWMKTYNIAKADGKTTKDIAQTVIKRLFPQAEVWTPRGKYLDGRGDALLMANYARQLYTS